MDNVKVADDYKDRLFRMIFNDKEKLLADQTGPPIPPLFFH